MPQQHDNIFLNLRVHDLDASMKFFRALGYSFNMDFTNESAACLELGPNLYTMLLTTDFFEAFAPNDICDTKKFNEVLTCLSCDSRKEVDALVEKAVAAGGQVFREPQDHGFMYSHAFIDLDGHVWELAYMEEAAA